MEKRFLTYLQSLLLVFFVVSTSFGQEPKGTNIVDYSKLKYTRCNPEFGEVTRVGDESGEQTILSIETKVRPKFIYKVSTSIPLKKQALKKGQVVLLSFKGKTVKSGLETGEARFLWILNQNESYKGNIDATISLPKEWKTFYVPFELTQDVLQKDLKLVIQAGFPPQIGLISNITLKVFPIGTPISTLPKTAISYDGMEPDATWRKEANKRIEQHRKGDFSIQFYKNGKPIQGENVSIQMDEHHFLWGATLRAKDIVSSIPHIVNLKKGFNLAVLENDLKIKSWAREQKREQILNALDILNEHKVKVKGHVLIWPGFHYLTANFKDNKDNPKKVEKLTQEHLTSILNATKGKISHWDVVNEAYTNTDLQEITGSEAILYNGFNVLAKKQPNVGRFTNEYGIISKGGIDTQKQEWYFNYIKRVDAQTNGLVDGLGIQCHMGSDLTTPKKVLSILDYYGQLHKKISISEFTMDLTDSAIRYQYTADFLTAVFSHPNVSEFLFWGFQNGNPKAVIYNDDWSLAPMGKAFFELVHNQWKTTMNAETNDKGEVKSRGFYGSYSYSIKVDGKLKSGAFNVLPNGSNTFKIDIK